ncbi:hypothetical protein [Demequina soli]|uniref:hypothetical protein n=1 Tax=Demequina soli TaxID=1638987 RepID=UPI000781AC54|nr:hypothetical protein [Demequina soli]
MSHGPVVLRADDARVAGLLAGGWRVVAESWAAELIAERAELERLERLVRGASAWGEVREIAASDVVAVLALDAATAGDYPGGVATRHEPLTRERARPTATRRAWAIVGGTGEVHAVTYVDVNGTCGETDFTVVARARRGRGLGTAVKAVSVLALVDEGVEVLRTGGSAENPASLAANTRLGYRVDERWVTLAPPA